MTLAVSKAIDAAPVRPQDAGAVELCRRYAALIDAAAPAAKYARHLERLEVLCATSDDPDAADAYRAVRLALAEHSVASDLGPKLLAALTALGLTLAGRSAGKGAVPGVGTGSAKLDELRARREQRSG